MKKLILSCPYCGSKRAKRSGGFAVDYNCGTRRGNLSELILWRTKKCQRLQKKRGRIAKRQRWTLWEDDCDCPRSPGIIIKIKENHAT